MKASRKKEEGEGGGGGTDILPKGFSSMNEKQSSILIGIILN